VRGAFLQGDTLFSVKGFIGGGANNGSTGAPQVIWRLRWHREETMLASVASIVGPTTLRIKPIRKAA